MNTQSYHSPPPRGGVGGEAVGGVGGEALSSLKSLPIEAVAERLGLCVTRHKSLCPYHDDHHASLTFNLRRNTFRCYACGAHGDQIDLAMHLLGKGFREACQWLADSHNIILSTRQAADTEEYRPPRPFDARRYIRHFEHPFLSAEAQRFLFEERRLDRRVVEWCRLNSWTDRQGTHWLEIPYFDQGGRLIGVQNRNLAPSNSPKGERANQKEDYSTQSALPPLGGLRGASGGLRASPRFRFPYGARCSIYNLPVVAMLRPGEELYITEGASDCWAMLSAGHKAIAIPSATLLSEADKRQLVALAAEKQTSFHMYPDRDAPGERLFMQLQEVLPALEHHQLAEGCKDYAEMYKASPPTPPP